MASLLGKHKISVETGSLADGDSIAAYLTSAAGTLLTNTTIGAKEHLDTKGPSEFAEGTAQTAGDYVTVAGAVDSNGDYKPLEVDANGNLLVAGTLSVDFSFDYAEDSAHTTGDIGAFTLAVRRDVRTSGVSADGDYASFNVNANGEMWVHDEDVKAELIAANSSLDAIEASSAAIESDVDAIRVELLDQGTTLDSILADTATIDTNIASILTELQGLSHAEDAAHVSGDLGIQALAVRKDASGSNAADGDYTSLQTWSEGSLKVVDVANASILQQRIAVTGTAAALPASALSNRRSIMLQNAGSASVYIGSATVTASGATAGIEVPKGSFIELEAGPAVSVYAISGGGSVNVNVLEMA